MGCGLLNRTWSKTMCSTCGCSDDAHRHHGSQLCWPRPNGWHGQEREWQSDDATGLH